MPPKHAKNPQLTELVAPAQAPEPIPFGSREDQVERRQPALDDQTSIEERRKNDDVGGED